MPSKRRPQLLTAMILGKVKVEGAVEEVVEEEEEGEVEVGEDKKMIDVNGKKLIKFIGS